MIAVSFPEFVEIWNRVVQRQATPAHHVRIASWLEACWLNDRRRGCRRHSGQWRCQRSWRKRRRLSLQPPLQRQYPAM